MTSSDETLYYLLVESNSAGTLPCVYMFPEHLFQQFCVPEGRFCRIKQDSPGHLPFCIKGKDQGKCDCERFDSFVCNHMMQHVKGAVNVFGLWGEKEAIKVVGMFWLVE